MKNKIISIFMLLVFSVTSLTSCMGRSGLSQKVVKFNMEAAETPWGREGLFLGLWITLVYPISGLLDLFIFNSIEFWTGENPINGKSPLVDLPMEDVRKMGFINVEKAQIERLSSTEAKMILSFENGDIVSFDVLRDADKYRVSYRGVDFHEGAIK